MMPCCLSRGFLPVFSREQRSRLAGGPGGRQLSPDIKFCRLIPTPVLPSNSDSWFAADGGSERQSLLGTGPLIPLGDVQVQDTPGLQFDGRPPAQLPTL